MRPARPSATPRTGIAGRDGVRFGRVVEPIGRGTLVVDVEDAVRAAGGTGGVATRGGATTGTRSDEMLTLGGCIEGSVFGAASNSPEIGAARIGRLLAHHRLAEEAADLVVERARLQLAQHRLVLRLHQLLHAADFARRIVVEALGREDGPVVEQVREDVRVVDARILGLHVPQTAGIADVVVVAEDGTARFHDAQLSIAESGT